MSENNSTLNQTTIEQLKVSIGEIASMAYIVKQLATQATTETGENHVLGGLVDAIQVIAEKTGFLADLCLDKVGGGLHVGNAEDWMLPPTYHKAVEQKAD